MYITKGRAFLQFITGETFDVSRFKCTYDLITEPDVGRIPRAEVTIPLGTSIQTGTTNAGVALVENFEYFRFNICSLFVDTDTAAFQNPQWTNSKIGTYRYQLFVGFPIAVAESFVGQNEITVVLIHWLAFLAAPYIFNLVIPHLAIGELSRIYPNLGVVVPEDVHILIKLSQIPQALFRKMTREVDRSQWDLWWHVLFPILDIIIRLATVVASRWRVDNRDITFRYLGTLARRALWSTNRVLSSIPIHFSHIENNPEIPKLLRRMLPGYAGGFRKVIRKMVDVIRRNMISDIGTMLAAVQTNEQAQNYASPLLFLLTCLQHFHCALVPYPTFYGIIPFCLGLQDYWKPNNKVTVLPGDIYHLNLSRQQDISMLPPRIILAIQPETSSVGNPAEEHLALVSVSGFYKSKFWKFGYIRSVILPFFYRNIKSIDIKTIDDDFEKKLLQLANEEEKDLQRRAQLRKEDKAISLVARIFADLYAHYSYILHQIQNRVIQVTTPFRGDIAPGSTIRIQIAHPYDLTDNRTVCHLQGTVSQVQYLGDSQQGLFSNYTVIGWRILPEVYHPDFSTAIHPIYGTFWKGENHLLSIPLS